MKKISSKSQENKVLLLKSGEEDQDSISRKFPPKRPDTVIVFRGNPPNYKGQVRGWWFTAIEPLNSKILTPLCENYNAFGGFNKWEPYKWYRWDELGWTGWWTVYDLCAENTVKALQTKGVSVEWVDDLPFSREFLKAKREDPRWEEKPQTTLWKGDYCQLFRILLALDTLPNAPPEQKAWVKNWIKLYQTHGVLSRAVVLNINRMCKMDEYVPYLLKKGVLRIWNPPGYFSGYTSLQ